MCKSSEIMRLKNTPKRSQIVKLIFKMGSQMNIASDFRAWAKLKQAHYPKSIDQLVVEISDPYALSKAEKQAITEGIHRANMVLYACVKDIDQKPMVKALAAQLGLQHTDKHLCADPDGISSIEETQNRQIGEYIPYTNKPINWHTDGYYNPPEHTIRAMLLHCVQAAANGGENGLVDHEMVYIYLYNKNPAYISALSRANAMSIPANIVDGEIIRAEQSGPVFSIINDRLHMRYTARTKSIEWLQDDLVLEAVDALSEFLKSDHPWIFYHRMEAGQGLICNNVLHKRTGFNNDEAQAQSRLLFRARYYDGMDALSQPFYRFR